LDIFSFKYSPPRSLFSSSLTGKVGVYDKGGFIKTFSSSQEEFKNEIEQLKEKFDEINYIFSCLSRNFSHSSLWITRGTRAIIFDFTVYNANMNMFCQVQ